MLFRLFIIVQLLTGLISVSTLSAQESTVYAPAKFKNFKFTKIPEETPLKLASLFSNRPTLFVYVDPSSEACMEQIGGFREYSAEFLGWQFICVAKEAKKEALPIFIQSIFEETPPDNFFFAVGSDAQLSEFWDFREKEPAAPAMILYDSQGAFKKEYVRYDYADIIPPYRLLDDLK